jgi:outer membrane protein assembly factor BamB
MTVPNSAPRPRFWPAVVILAAGAAALAAIWLTGDTMRQIRTLRTLATASLMLVALILWLAFFSRLPRRLRLTAAGLAVAGLAAFAGLFRIRGVSGDLVPILQPRWSRARDPRPAPPGAVAPSEPPGSDTAAYPQFLGPTRDGTLPGPRLARDWSARPPRLLWRQPIGEGWSGFAVRGGVAVTQEQDGPLERVLACDPRTGRTLWSHDETARYSTVIAGTGPRATPTLHEGRVFVMGATGLLTGLELATGRRLWTRDVLRDNGAALPDWGKSCSPLVVDGRVIVSAGGASGRSLVAYDAESGGRAWSAGSDRSSYSSPVLLNLAGRPQVVILNQASVAGYDPKSGAALWEQPFPGGQPNVAAPIRLADDRLLVSVGYGVGSKAYRIADTGAGLQAALAWETPHLKSKFANLVVHGGYVYGLDDGILTCLDPSTGERRWKAGRYGHGQVLLVGDLLLLQTEDGEIVLLDPSPEGQRELTRFRVLDGKTWNPPALAGRLLLVRNDREAAAYELPTE